MYFLPFILIFQCLIISVQILLTRISINLLYVGSVLCFNGDWELIASSRTGMAGTLEKNVW